MARRTPHRCGALPAAEPYLRMIRFQGLRAVKEKRTLPRTTAGVSELAYVAVLALSG